MCGGRYLFGEGSIDVTRASRNYVLRQKHHAAAHDTLVNFGYIMGTGTMMNWFDPTTDQYAGRACKSHSLTHPSTHSPTR